MGTRQMRILVIAPRDANLPNSNVEVAAIRRHHTDVTVLPSPIRDTDIANAINDAADAFDIIWWIAHGNSNGIALSDGYVLPVAGVVGYVKRTGAGLCVLNTCASEDIAIEIASNTPADVICTISVVYNDAAVRFGVNLAGELAHSDDHKEAFEVVADGSIYRFVPTGQPYRRRSDINDDFVAEMRSVFYDDKFGRKGLPGRVSDLEKTATDHHSRLERLARRTDDMEAANKELRDDMDNLIETTIKGKIILSPIMAAAIAVVIFFLVGLVIYFAFRGGGQIDGSVGFAISVLSDSAFRRASLFWFYWASAA